jgi:hypothetical protein
MNSSMPFLFVGFPNRYAKRRKACVIIGTAISVGSLVLSAFAISDWHLVITQGTLQALGSTLPYSSTTIFVDEWFLRRNGFAGRELLKVGGVGQHDWAYGTKFGSLVIFCGVTAAFGGWGAISKILGAMVR